tara:strand:+ start:188 stop:325 length:138 start_codon:yes stop_codon:yes gene_type:complete
MVVLINVIFSSIGLQTKNGDNLGVRVKLQVNHFNIIFVINEKVVA